jgi:hypothetical protein
LRSKKPLFSREQEVIPPYVLALRALDEIREEKPWQHGKTKEYYTRLTGALRGYLEGELEIPALEQTSHEILRDLSCHDDVPARDREELERLLETADLVKFAKAAPLPDEELHHLNVAYDFVNHTNDRVTRRKEEERAGKEDAAREEDETAPGEGS